MNVYQLRKELEKWPQDSKVIFCVGTGVAHWFDELQPDDLSGEPGKLVLAR
jgi:hypothetical protein